MKMKKRKTIIMIVCVLLAAALGITAIAAVSSRNKDKVRRVQKVDVNSAARCDLDGYLAENERSLSEQPELVPPVYKDSDILLPHVLVLIGRDYSMYENLNSGVYRIGTTLTAFPDAAIRERDESSSYVMYDTDTGYRVYLHLSDINQKFIPVGFTLIVKDKHSHDEFSEIKVGDPISAVEAIDSTATVVRRFYGEEGWNIDPISVPAHAEDGYAMTSMHYLSDGLLKIEYGMMDDNGVAYITNIEFSENYVMTDPLGREINYKILDNDLPW